MREIITRILKALKTSVECTCDFSYRCHNHFEEDETVDPKFVIERVIYCIEEEFYRELKEENK
jgi:hypothetical protein